MELREYQRRSIDDLYAWFGENKTGNPCLVLPTGSGKSHVIASLCKEALQSWPSTKILMLTHQKELIEQNAEKLLLHWPTAPIGIYSAGIGRREFGMPITFAGIQSVRGKANLIGHQDLILIDECFVAGTKVSTPTGPKDIDIVRCGDTAYNAHGVGSVLGVSARPSQDIYKLEFSDGTFIECTGSHPFFTERGWKQAGELEVGAHFFSIEGLRMLWSSVSSLDQEGQGNKQDHFVLSRASLDQARLLLNILCEEIEKPNEQSSGSLENESEAEGDKAQAYQAWRQRAVVAFGTASFASRFGGGMGSRVGDTYKNEESWNRFSDLLQSGFGKSVNEASYRAGRSKSLQPREKGSRLEEDGFSCFPRLERISRIQSACARTVFNIQVSGHPSYFANGKLVHNCHLVSHKEEGGYRTLLAELLKTNPAMRVIGLTATPYRLGHGMITDKPALFDALIEPIGIMDLVAQGYLAPLRSKVTSHKIDVTGVRKRGGEYIESELQEAVDTHDSNVAVVREIIQRAEGRKAWLFFCAGVVHAEHIAELLREHGVRAARITGDTPREERERLLADFKSGRLRALTNANVLTTGFDYPDIDLIAMLRPTMSASLYVQMAGRGMRLKSHTDYCLVLDFAGNVATHGPVTHVQPPRKKGEGDGVAPSKTCESCGEIVHAAVRVCPACGNEFPPPKKAPLELHDDDIMQIGEQRMRVTRWVWDAPTSRSNGIEMLRVRYYGDKLNSPIINDYFCINHGGYAARKAAAKLAGIIRNTGIASVASVDDLNAAMPPASLVYEKSGNFFNVLSLNWERS